MRPHESCSMPTLGSRPGRDGLWCSTMIGNNTLSGEHLPDEGDAEGHDASVAGTGGTYSGTSPFQISDEPPVPLRDRPAKERLEASH